jgi:hypothetical protein
MIAAKGDLLGHQGQEFDRAEPGCLILLGRFQIIVTVRSQDRQISRFSDFPCRNSRYKDGTTKTFPWRSPSILTGRCRATAA